MRRTVVVVVIALVAFPVLAGAQTSSTSDPELRLQKQPRRVIVSPRPAPETAVQDTEEVRKDIERESRADAYSRELPTRPPRRPDLDRDVTGGIQSRSINRR